MKLRSLLLAVVVLGVLSVVAFFRTRPPAAPADDPRVGTPLLASDTVSKASAIVISEKGKSAELVRDADGSWHVREYFGMPADVGKISHLVQDLNEAKVDRFVTASPERLARLEFGDAFIELKDGSGKELWRLYLGKNSDSGNGRFIRFGEEPKAFYSTLHVWLDTEAKGWADPALLSLKPSDVARVEIPFEGSPATVLTRAKADAPWTAAPLPPGQAPSAEKISSLLASLTSLRFTDSLDPKDPLAAAAAAHLRGVTLTTFDGKSYGVALGRTPEEKKLKVAAPDAKQAVAAIGKVTDEKGETKPIAPEFDTVPAGPVFAVVSSSDPKAPVNALMKSRAFEVDEYALSALPQKPGDLLEPAKAK
jgi:hypothetical protein